MAAVNMNRLQMRANIHPLKLSFEATVGDPSGAAVQGVDADCATSFKPLLQHCKPAPGSPTAGAMGQRRSYRRSCHGSAPEQQGALRESWDNAVTTSFRKSLRDSWDLKQLRAAAEGAISSSCKHNEDACGSHQQDQQQELLKTQAVQSMAAPAAPAAIIEPTPAAVCSLDPVVTVTVQLLERSVSPCAATETEPVACHSTTDTLSITEHSSHNSRVKAESSSTTAEADSSAVSKVPKPYKRAKQLMKAMFHGL